MKNITSFALATSVLLGCGFLYAKEEAEGKKDEVTLPDVSKISEAFGHVIAKNIEGIGFKFDLAQVIKGLQDEAEGKPSSLSEKECLDAISAIQEKLFKEKCSDNLQKAESFLVQNAKISDVISLENGKVQYKIEQAGEGESVAEHNSPLIRYTGKFLDGTVFGTSTEDEMLSLDEIIPGLKKGLVGMKEGEKRIIYIHPDLAYGVHGFLPPNSLLTFEIEIVKANAPHVEPETQVAPTKRSEELADSESHLR